jgi:hypothetical protein
MRRLIKAFLLYRTYHGSAMSPVVQAASIAAWGDEAHVGKPRPVPREVRPGHAPAGRRDGCGPARCRLLPLGQGARPGHDSDTEFARELLAQYNVTVLPGSYLAREAAGQQPRRRAASAWPWWPNRKNAWKPPSASSNSSNPVLPENSMTQQLQQIIDRVGQPRQPLARRPPPKK